MATIPIRPFRVAHNGDRHAAHRNVGIGTLTFKVTTADSNGAFWWSRLCTMPKAALLDIYITIRTSGSTSLRVNTLSKLARSGTGWGRATRPSDPVEYHTAGST